MKRGMMGDMSLPDGVRTVVERHKNSGKPLAVILAGHNGSGKSTLWYEHVVDTFRIPLVNADRMMLSILPEARDPRQLPQWAVALRDTDAEWMRVAQKGVESFVAQAIGRKVPFAQETVFSHWLEHPDGRVESKIDLIRTLQKRQYFVLLMFVGLRDSQLSIARVKSRKADGGHDVEVSRLIERFPRTQKAIAQAVTVADASILFDNSRDPKRAFTVARIQARKQVIYDIRRGNSTVPQEIMAWLKIVCPKFV